MVRRTLGRIAPAALLLTLAIAGVAATEAKGVAQDTSQCGLSSGPLCQEVKTCRPTGPAEWSCGTMYNYYPIEAVM